MASLALVSYEISVQDAGGYPVYRAPAPRRFSPGAGTNGVQQYVTLTASVYTALTIPAGAKFLAIFLGQATSLTLKGATGDATGVAITPSANPVGFDLLMPLAPGASVGILNGLAANQTVEVLFL